MKKPQIPVPQIVYGNVTFWLCITAALICVLGPVLALAFPGNNLLNPQTLFAIIWEGNKPETVWRQVGGEFPGGHFWLCNLDTWDGVTQLGVVIGCVSVFGASLAASVTYLRAHPWSYGWASVSAVLSVMVLLSAVGVVQI